MPYSFNIEKDTDEYLNVPDDPGPCFGSCPLCGEPAAAPADLHEFRVRLSEGPAGASEFRYFVHRSCLVWEAACDGVLVERTEAKYERCFREAVRKSGLSRSKTRKS